MRILEILEAATQKIVAIYPGRFQPFHKGHGAVYNYLRKQYGGKGDVFISTSDVSGGDRHPMGFADKKQLMSLVGGDPNAVIQTKNPYNAVEITGKYDPEKIVVLYVVSEKDMADDPRFSFPDSGEKMLKSGKGPTHFQRWTSMEDAKPFAEHSYIGTVPTFEFKVLGKPATSASEIRANFKTAKDEEQKEMFIDLFGKFDENAFDMLKKRLG